MSTKKLQILGSLGNSDADTLDGKHASDFAAATDFEDLKTLVGDEAVSTQITNAISGMKFTLDSDGVLVLST